MNVKRAEWNLNRMLVEAGVEMTAPNFPRVWSVLRAFCQMPVEPEQGLPPEEQFSWEFYVEEPWDPLYLVAGFLRSIAFSGGDRVEECFCMISFAYAPAHAAFAEPEVVEGFDASNTEAFFVATERSRGYRAALQAQPVKIELHQTAL